MVRSAGSSSASRFCRQHASASNSESSTAGPSLSPRAFAYHDGDKVYAGRFEADPAYNQSQSDPHDVAVVVLDKAVKGIAPATLPKAGSLSNLSGSQLTALDDLQRLASSA
ncbi:MAG: hypothetical protein LC640_04880 [Frankia sp.]|nr:hypothetical protein [Frankia sp.]